MSEEKLANKIMWCEDAMVIMSIMTTFNDNI